MKKTLLIIGLVWPEPNSSAAGSRMLQLIRLFLEQHWNVVFASAAQENEISYPISSLGVTKQQIVLNCSSFDTFIAELNPELVLFDRFISEEQFGWRVIENCPNAIRVLDTEDLHCLRYARQKAFQKRIPFQWQDLLTEEIAKREIASMYRSDLSLLISLTEMQIMKEIFQFREEQLYYLPLFSSKKSSIISWSQREDFVFIGNFLHEPNWDAVIYLKQEIWSKIKKQLPKARLHIYGAYASAKVFQLHNEKDGFFVHGRADDAQEVIQKAKVLLAPLRFGAGIKGKLLEAMEVGTPSVTSTIGAEGIGSDTRWNGFIANTVEDFVKDAVVLYNDEEIWSKSQEIGWQILKNNFDSTLFQRNFAETMDSLRVNILERRKHNFIGNLLQQQQWNSTKYMSKWIEEKNKN